MSTTTLKNNDRKLRDDAGYWIQHAASGVGHGVRYLVDSKGLKRDVTNFTRKQRNQRYKKKLMEKRKRILKVQAALDKLITEEKGIYEKYRRDKEWYQFYDDKILKDDTSLDRYSLYRK